MGLGSAVAWPIGAQAQQAMPMIGYLAVATLDSTRETVAAVLRGLSETGYVEGRNLAIEYRWAEDRMGRLPGLAVDLVSRRVDVIVCDFHRCGLGIEGCD